MGGKIRMALLAAAVAIPGLAYGQSADLAAEEKIIRQLDEQWVAAVAEKDSAAVAQFYAEDGAILPAGAPLAEGREAVAKVWGGFFGLKDFALFFAPTRIDLSTAGDMASDIGTYTLSFESEAGPVQDKGKYVVVWKKIDGMWKVAADIFNSDGGN